MATPSTARSAQYTVLYTMAAYEVRDAAGVVVGRYAFDPKDFHGSRRQAYREALDDAAVRNEAAEAAAARCPRCGEVPDRLGRCGCDYQAAALREAYLAAPDGSARALNIRLEMLANERVAGGQDGW